MALPSRVFIVVGQLAMFIIPNLFVFINLSVFGSDLIDFSVDVDVDERFLDFMKIKKSLCVCELIVVFRFNDN